MTIALLVPSKGRATLCNRMIQSAFRTTTRKIHVYVCVTTEEFCEYTDTIKIPESDRFGAVIVTMPDCPTVHRWNRLAELALMQKDTQLFMLASDDVVFSTPCWDEALLERYDNKPHVYHLQDSRDSNGTPHPLVTREWIDVMGWAFPPIFLHWFLDSWTVEIAKANNCFTHLKDYLLEHLKPSDHGVGDATHNDIRRRGFHDRDLWVNAHCQDILQMYKEKLKCAFSSPE
jgi:hypothetical protein